ncbi:hypothetical protein Hanom_Chr14g01311371 [Helianthus anomalus]
MMNRCMMKRYVAWKRCAVSKLTAHAVISLIHATSQIRPKHQVNLVDSITYWTHKCLLACGPIRITNKNIKCLTH